MPELRKRAVAAGISKDDIEEARDADEPKKDMIALIVAATPRNQGATRADVIARQAASQRALKAELQQLKMPELRKRAAAAGISKDDIEDARDADEPKGAMISLILSAHASASQPIHV